MSNEQFTDDRWRTLSSEYLHREPWLTVRKDHVILPNGNHIPAYYVLEYPDWVNTIAITKEGQFVFVRQYRHAIAKTAYELCGGVCDTTDSSPLMAAQRELLEETGYGNGRWEEWMRVCPNSSANNNTTFCFLARDVEPVSEPHLEATESLSVCLFSPQEVKRMLYNNEILQALMVAPLWKLFATTYHHV